MDAGVFIHRTTTANRSGNVTYIDHPLTNYNPNAIVFITPNWNPGGTGGVYNDHAIGVYYSLVQDKWAIFSQDKAAMPISATFNVLVPISDTTVFVHQATVENTIAHFTTIDHPLANDNPHALVFITQNWNPGGSVSGTYNDRAIGVAYEETARRWVIVNQDRAAAMPEGAAFNVMIKASKVYLPLAMR